MSVHEILRDAVAKKNIGEIRNYLWSTIVLDPGFSSSFPNALKYCFDNGITEAELFEPHDGRDLNVEPTQDSFSLLGGQLRTNFSKERLEKMKEIGKILYPPIENKQKKANALSRFDRDDVLRLMAASSAGALVFGIVGVCLFKKDITGIDIAELGKKVAMVQRGVAFGFGFGAVVGAGLGAAAGIVINKIMGKERDE